MEFVSRMAFPLALGVVLLTIAVSGEAQDLRTIVDGVQARYQQTPHFQARFHQTSTLATLGEKQESKGKVFIRKPGMMRWEYHSPEKQMLVSDGVNFWVYTPRQNQVIVSHFGEAFQSKTPLAFLAGNGNIRDEFNVQFEGKSPDSKKEDPDVYRLSLRPKAPHPSLRELRLDVRKSDYMIVRSVLIDPFGNVTDIRFAEIRVDETLPLDLFTFKIPPGVEIVQAPQPPANR